MYFLYKPFLFENAPEWAFLSAKSNVAKRISNAQRCKTKYNISTAILDKAVNKLGPFFAHKTQCYCNKICGFGKVMAIISIILGFVRLNYLNNPNIIIYIFGYGLTCLLLAFLMNMDAFIYLIPLIITEIIIILSLYQKNKKKDQIKKDQIKKDQIKR
jgi:hypothetical protein